MDRTRREATVLLEPFTTIPRARLDLWEAEVEDVAGILGEPLRLAVAS